ncbi:MAG TPA: hypothetical protein VKA55_00410 [Gammaproteobacteria bacterium]|nr:hypothetical protein [Gammaproteobacteria bacterium]
MIHVEQAIARAREALDAGRLDAAERELRAVLEFDDGEQRALRLLGKVASRRGEPQRAAELFQRALGARRVEGQARPQGPRPTPTLAELYADQGYLQAAAEVYRELLAGGGDAARSQEWRRRLSQLEGGQPETSGAGARAEPEAEAGGAPELPSGPGAQADREPAPPGAAEERREVDPATARERLEAFLQELDADSETERLRRFLQGLGSPPAQ